MTEVIGIRFKSDGRVYFFDPDGNQLHEGDYGVVETARGIECGEIAEGNHEVRDDQIVKPLKKLIRKATDADIKRMNENREKEKASFGVCEQMILSRNLDMKLVDVEYSFDGSKIVFYFTADGRIDFRDLVKDLASHFHTRIELRQIGVRDEAKMLGGIGICGQQFCCSRFLSDFQPVSIKMAKEQGLSLNPTKISGSCGRLMCCLKYEQDAYDQLLSMTPHIGWIVSTPSGDGVVTDANLISGDLLVRLSSDESAAPLKFNRSEVTVVRKSRAGKERQPKEPQE